jgi:hypothetical protein
MTKHTLREGKNRHLEGKGESNAPVSENDSVELIIPRRYHGKVEPFLGKDLTMQVYKENEAIRITLTPTSNPSRESDSATQILAQVDEEAGDT